VALCVYKATFQNARPFNSYKGILTVARRNSLVQHNQGAVTGTWLRCNDRWHSASMLIRTIPPSDPALALVIYIFSDSSRESLIKGIDAARAQ